MRQALLAEQVRRLKFENDATESRLVRRDLLVAGLKVMEVRLREVLNQRLAEEYPRGVAGLDVPEARIFGKRIHDALMRDFQDMASLLPE